jgi:ParB family chromosome partitioning protein
MADENRPRLGRGLAALLGEQVAAPASAADAAAPRAPSRKVPIEFLRPNPRNPRKYFDEAYLDELTESIRERGLIQPIVVRPVRGTPDAYEIIAGERRWRASQRAGLHDVPIHLIDADDKMALELAIVENIQRADLNAIEEAGGYEQLMREFSYTQADLGKVLGKSRSHVANTLRLLNLSDSLKEKVRSGQLSAGHARALLTVQDPEALAQLIISKGLSVRDVERLAQEQAEGAQSGPKKMRRVKQSQRLKMLIHALWKRRSLMRWASSSRSTIMARAAWFISNIRRSNSSTRCRINSAANGGLQRVRQTRACARR